MKIQTSKQQPPPTFLRAVLGMSTIGLLAVIAVTLVSDNYKVQEEGHPEARSRRDLVKMFDRQGAPNFSTARYLYVGPLNYSTPTGIPPMNKKTPHRRELPRLDQWWDSFH